MTKPTKPGPVFVLTENGTAVAVTKNRREAENWMFTDEQDYVAFDDFASIPLEMKNAILSERLRALTLRIERAEIRTNHRVWEKSALRRALTPEPANIGEFGIEKPSASRWRGGPLHMMFAGIWPERRN
jgi:hypothetical protein